MSAAKRASVGGASSSKRARGADADIVASCHDIALALSTSTGYPESMLKMLAAGLAPALGTVKEERHVSQTQVVTWVDEVMSSMGQHLDSAVAQSTTAAEAARAAQASKETAVAECEAVAQTREEAKDASAVACSQAASDLSGAESALAKAQQAQAKADKEIDALSTKKAAVESLISGAFKELKESAGSKKAISSFMTSLKKEKAEELLLATALVTFARAPEARGDFDKLILAQIDELLSKRVSDFEGQIATATESKGPLASAVEEAEKVLTAAKEAHAAADASLAEAQAAASEAAAALSEAKKARKEAGPEVKATELALKQASKAAEQFKANELAAFVKLRDRAAPQPEPVDAVAPVSTDSVPAEAVVSEQRAEASASSC